MVSTNKKILIVDDEQDILELIRYHLEREGYAVSVLERGDKVVVTAATLKPDLIVLDIMLPGTSGLDVCRAIKADASLKNTPVIMLTAKGEDSDVISGLEVGADDYVVKPFSPKVLVARVRNQLRRTGSSEVGAQKKNAKEETLTIKDIVIHVGRHEVTLAGKPLELTFTEFRVLELLARKPGWVFSRQQIVDGVRGDDYPVTERSVDVQIVGLRRKLGARGESIETVRGVGYRFKE